MEELIRTYNVELKADEQSAIRLERMLKSYKEAYDLCAREIVSNDVPLNIRDVHDTMYTPLRNSFPELPAQQCIKVYKDAMGAIRSARKNKHKEFETPVKKNLSARLDKRLYGRLTPASIEITADIGNGGRVKCEFVQYDKLKEMFSLYTVKDPLLFLRDGRLFLSIPFVVPSLPVQDETCLGVDLGMKRLFVTSEGKAFRDKTYLRERRKVRYLKRCLQSKGTKSSKRHLLKLSRREKNLSKDMCRRAANALIGSTNASYIVLEDLKKLKQKTSRKNGHLVSRHNNAIGQVPFYLFKETVGHKALHHGKRVVTVSPYNTSKTDSRSGKTDGIRNGCRYYCSDGVVLDADFNASVNIALRSNHPLSTSMLPTGSNLVFLGAGRCQPPKRLPVKDRQASESLAQT